MLIDEAPWDMPATPAELSGAPVAAWRAPVSIDTYLPEAPDRYPAYLDSRVYQGSSGRVYPLPFHDRISQVRRPHEWDAIHLENAWLRVLVLPELGGRIHLAYDKANDYEMFYRNPVIKPALVGLAGPWIAGGVEFNWPQHHRPATFLPTVATIEHEPDGAVTVWCSDHDPFARMKGMHGVRLHPDRAVIELRVRLYNRSEQTETFLWWANVAARVDAGYQSFFPEDVHVVADHAKRAVTTFPAADGTYYGVDYPARRDLTTHEGSEIGVPGDRIDWYRNIPVPTSYMCLDSRGDFFGGYDHGAGGGFVHWADHHYAVGKKQWTWGNAPFGHAWDRNLADDDAAYIELMAGVFTDNQPDFSFIAPGETKAFSQYWYPVRDTGPLQQASLDAALSVSLRQVGDTVSCRLAVQSTRRFAAAEITLTSRESGPLWSAVGDLEPGGSVQHTIELSSGVMAEHLRVTVTAQGHELVVWTTPEPAPEDPPVAAAEPPAPTEVASVEELYLTGVHLQQYRHATRSPEPYWREALARDPQHAGAHTALAARRYNEGRFEAAERHLRAAVARLTLRNPNPIDGEPHYRLGLTLVRLGRDEEAYDAFAKASWSRGWRPQASFQLGRLDARRGRDQEALRRVDECLAVEPDHLQARNLRTVLLRRLGDPARAAAQLSSTLALDPLDAWALTLADAAGGAGCDFDAQTALDVALECAGVGETAAALSLLELAVARDVDRALGSPACAVTARYHQAVLYSRLGDPTAAGTARRLAREADAGWNFPGRLDDAVALLEAVAAEPGDARAHALLGHWLYAHDRRSDALASWRRSAELDPSDPVVWRNIAVGSFNVDNDAPAAVTAYEQALRLAPGHARLWYERDQLAKRTGEPVRTRLERLTPRLEAVAERDDLSVELAALLVADGALDEALRVLLSRAFQPWEGGEGLVLRAWERTQLALARRELQRGDRSAAVAHAQAALDPPPSLGEARHELANAAQLLLVLGEALAADGRSAEARAAWQRAADAVADFQGMAPQPYSENTFYAVLACRRLGWSDRAERLVEGLRGHVEALAGTPATVDYFATSLPSLLLFSDDPQRHRDQQVAVLRAQLSQLAGATAEADARLGEILRVDPAAEAALDLRQWVGTVPVLPHPSTDSVPQPSRSGVQ